MLRLGLNFSWYSLMPKRHHATIFQANKQIMGDRGGERWATIICKSFKAVKSIHLIIIHEWRRKWSIFAKNVNLARLRAFTGFSPLYPLLMCEDITPITSWHMIGLMPFGSKVKACWTEIFLMLDKTLSMQSYDCIYRRFVGIYFSSPNSHTSKNKNW